MRLPVCNDSFLYKFLKTATAFFVQKKMNTRLFILLLWSNACVGQSNKIAHLSFWKPTPGQEQPFAAGYQRHLKWHAEHKDQWKWYGWYFISGARTGVFLDATTDHRWEDFDHPVAPAEDGKDVDLQVAPFGTYLYAQKLALLEDISYADSTGMKSKYLRLVTLEVNNIPGSKILLQKLGQAFKAKGLKNFFVYQMIDGGSANQLQLLLGADSFAALAITESLADNLTKIEQGAQQKQVLSMLVETLRYEPEMSWFPK